MNSLRKQESAENQGKRTTRLDATKRSLQCPWGVKLNRELWEKVSAIHSHVEYVGDAFCGGFRFFLCFVKFSLKHVSRPEDNRLTQILYRIRIQEATQREDHFDSVCTGHSLISQSFSIQICDTVFLQIFTIWWAQKIWSFSPSSTENTELQWLHLSPFHSLQAPLLVLPLPDMIRVDIWS